MSDADLPIYSSGKLQYLDFFLEYSKDLRDKSFYGGANVELQSNLSLDSPPPSNSGICKRPPDPAFTPQVGIPDSPALDDGSYDDISFVCGSSFGKEVSF